MDEKLKNVVINKDILIQNLELKVKLLQDALTSRNVQIGASEGHNNQLIRLLDTYDRKLALLNEELSISQAQLRYQSHSYKNLDEMITYHKLSLERLFKFQQID